MSAIRQMLKPVQLQLILTIAEQGQLLQAAEVLGMTQPAASRMLAEIERQLGAALFQRQPRGMIPTEIGKMVLARAAVILRELQGLGQHLRNVLEGLGGTVRVGAVTGPAVGIMVSAVRDLKRIAPEAEITVEVLPSRDLLTQLVAGEMDFVLARNLPEFDGSEFIVHPMADEKVSILARADHPLADAPLVTLPMLQDHEWVAQQRGTPIREAVLSAFSSQGLAEPRNVINSPSSLLALAYLAQSFAVAPVSSEVAEILIRPPVAARLVALPLAVEIVVAPYYLLHMRRRALSALALRLRDRVLEGQKTAR
ncbi:LysR family transcriptional regulator [Xinfangfangia pollutisoli]|uniref:LysR family transcriptional regulator n=1 Tax=Xinfangfangia pollutisoli TaxID=2865960 RepID=UPI001CD6C079|nr:LysR family transcriptional regulator [Xinfangfangia pollutisoli]